MAQQFYDFDEARKHKSLWQGVWARVIWVNDAGDDDLAVIHWMGGTYKVVGRYKSTDRDAMAKSLVHAEQCSKAGYCPGAPGDAEAYRAHQSR